MTRKTALAIAEDWGVSLEGNRQNNMFHIGCTNHLDGVETLYIKSMKTSETAVSL